MTKRKEYYKILIQRYKENRASNDELDVFFELLREGELDGLLESNMEGDKRFFIEDQDKKIVSRYSNKRIWASIAAAVLVVVIGVGGIRYFGTSQPISDVVLLADVASGGNNATLRLADGRIISLSEADSGALMVESGVQIKKTADGELAYTGSAEENGSDVIKYNTISTPRGGQFRVILPDGTIVWLNASSSLKYPINFSKLGERTVELDGEAYFEVAKDRNKPFLVLSKYQTVQVLGTQFNVKSYPDENEIETTLLEGKVRVVPANGMPEVELSPGTQAICLPDDLTVLEVNAYESIAWKEGRFVFQEESLNNILKKISRWYDVDVLYEDARAKEILFGGSMSRFDSISKVLNKLEIAGGVKFELTKRGEAAPTLTVRLNDD